MDGVGGTIKNKVFKEVKSGRLSVKSSKEFAAAAKRLVPSIVSLYMPISEILEEPHDIEESPKIPETLQVHKAKRAFNRQGVPLMEFYKLSNEENCLYTQYYGDVCGHKDKGVDENTCGHCHCSWGDNEEEEWLQCPICKHRFHNTCFHV